MHIFANVGEKPVPLWFRFSCEGIASYPYALNDTRAALQTFIAANPVTQ